MTTTTRHYYTKYTCELLEPLVAANTSVAGVMRALGFTVMRGGSHTHISKTIKRFSLDTSHFTGSLHNKGRPSKQRSTPDAILVLRTGPSKEKTHRLRRALLALGVPHICIKCSSGTTWCEEELVLEIDHINGNSLDNRRENLMFLCPNCHSQTSTYGSRNIKRNPKLPKNQEIMEIKTPKIRKARISKLKPLAMCHNHGCNVQHSNKLYCSYACSWQAQCKVVRPTIEQLKQNMLNMNWTALGKLYGVSDNAVRKWARAYGLI